MRHPTREVPSASTHSSCDHETDFLHHCFSPIRHASHNPAASVPSSLLNFLLRYFNWFTTAFIMYGLALSWQVWLYPKVVNCAGTNVNKLLLAEKNMPE